MKLRMYLRNLSLGMSFAAAVLGARTAHAQVEDKVCQLCHSEVKASPANPVAHGSLGCTDCHMDLAAWDPEQESEHAEKLGPVPCATCHATQAADLASGVHRDCKGCHGVEHFQPRRDSLAVASLRERDSATCSTCHAPAGEEFESSVHHAALARGEADAPGCVQCHGAHDVLPASARASTVHPLNLPETCERCHSSEESKTSHAPGGARIEQYETGAHGQALRKDGLVVSATCASCHGGHSVLATEDPAAPTARRNVPETCGKCHLGVLETYLEGVHGAAFSRGEVDVPVCTDCHSEHGVSATQSRSSHVSPSLVAETCARCHGDDEFAARHDLKSDVNLSWGSSYHGIAKALGAEDAANCASCHGFHAIFPSADPRSSVNPANLESTCGSCHPNAGVAFARVPVHSTLDEASNPVPFWVKTIYTALVVGVIGAFVLFILLDLYGRLRLRMGWGPRESAHVKRDEWPDEDTLVSPGERFVRMNRHGRFQHAILVSSFLLLVLTGVPVFLHDLGFMRSLIDLEGGFALRSKLHRVGAMGLIALSIWHVLVFVLSPGARRWVLGMFIRPRDVLDFVGEASFNLGLGRWLSERIVLAPLLRRFPTLAGLERPCRGRYGLVEKLEYMAVVWGNVVMIATGFILWRPDWFLDWTPAWTFDVCRVVHGFEATLAFLAIIIWHMYHVQMRPGSFLRNGVWFHGKMTRDELRHHHPGEYLEILRQRRAARLGS
jgi:cytochrome b subunit of formate dehydrogenase/nitrate/TMAO reductase-like tetraheme cytochrome c subunit